MSVSIDIPVVVEGDANQQIPSLNVEPILHEVRHALERLIKTGEPTTIDLRSMPLAPGEDEQIREKLGTGETVITIDALGPSTLTETAYSGVWWIEHRNSTDTVTGLYIEIAHVPAIVFPATEDMQYSLEELQQNLSLPEQLNETE